MIRLTYEQGNGYHCGCCRTSWTETEDFKTREQVIDWIADLESYKEVGEIPGFRDDSICISDPHDREVISIEEEMGVDIKYEFTPTKKDIQAALGRRLLFEIAYDKRKKEERKKEAEKQRFAVLKQDIKNNPDLAKEVLASLDK